MYECLKNIIVFIIIIVISNRNNKQCDEFEKQFIFLRNDLIYIILHLVL